MSSIKEEVTWIISLIYYKIKNILGLFNHTQNGGLVVWTFLTYKSKESFCSKTILKMTAALPERV